MLEDGESSEAGRSLRLVDDNDDGSNFQTMKGTLGL